MYITNTLFVGKVSYHFAELPSTNDHAADMLADGVVAEGTLVRADYQTAGRGQMGNTWQAEKGKNLTFSLIFYPRFLAARQSFLLSQAIALAVRDTLIRLLDQPVQIKWPNDILVASKKICGLLIQNTLSGQWIQSSIVGIGINVNQTTFPSDVTSATSLQLAGGKPYSREEVLAILLQQIEQRYLQLKAGNTASLQQDYLQHLYLRDQWSAYADAQGNRFIGKIRGVNEAGRLLVMTGEEERAFDVKQIQFLAESHESTSDHHR